MEFSFEWVETLEKLGNFEETQTKNKQKLGNDVVLIENKISLENVVEPVSKLQTCYFLLIFAN